MVKNIPAQTFISCDRCGCEIVDSRACYPRHFKMMVTSNDEYCMDGGPVAGAYVNQRLDLCDTCASRFLEFMAGK